MMASKSFVLQLATGNIIFKTFTDIEQAMAFMQRYHDNPQAILDEISPHTRKPDSP